MKLVRSGILALCAAFGLLPAAIHAQTQIFASSSADAFFRGIDGGMSDSDGPVNEASFDFKTLSTSLESSAEDQFETGSINSQASIEVRAAVGDLGVKISGFASTPLAFGVTRIIGSRASAEASWRESVRFGTTSGTPLDLYTVTFELILDGSVLASAAGIGTANVQFDLVDLGEVPTLPPDPYPNFNAWGYALANARSNIFILNDVPSITIPMTLTVLNGLEYTLGYRMKLDGRAQADDGFFGTGLAGFEGDVSGSLQWGGIQSVVDARGNVIPRDQWLITSESGFDYTRPFGVPEPTSLIPITIALGMALLGRPKRN